MQPLFHGTAGFYWACVWGSMFLGGECESLTLFYVPIMNPVGLTLRTADVSFS